jgi:hypothetical protein
MREPITVQKAGTIRTSKADISMAHLPRCQARTLSPWAYATQAGPPLRLADEAA